MNARKIVVKQKGKKDEAAHEHVHASDEYDILEALRSAGYRITAPRRAIVGALESASGPKTAKEIGVRTKIKDASTVYRTLSELVKVGLIEEFADGDVSYYEISHQHHDHAICSTCGKIEHIPCESEKTPRALTRAGWVIESHEALYRGLCGSCK